MPEQEDDARAIGDTPAPVPVEKQVVPAQEDPGDEGSSTTSTTLAEAPPATEEEPQVDSLGPMNGGGMVFALLSGGSGPEGDYTATPTSPSGTWQVGVGSGGFSWSYPMPIPAGPSGHGFELSLDYSSQSVDGMTAAKNSQSSAVGVGWDLGGLGYIERRYQSCRNDGQTRDDLCWFSDNATLVLNGVSSELVSIDGTQWAVKDDPNWKVERFTGATANGDNNGEWWKVTTPDGTSWSFGKGTEPTSGQDTFSAWTVPVYGDDAGEPCATSPGWCMQAWRWSADRMVDRVGNVTTMFWAPEKNKYMQGGVVLKEYTRGGRLDGMHSGQRSGFEDLTAPVTVDVTAELRCVAMASCPTPSPSTASHYPDAPVDLICSSTPCAQDSPSFFTTSRYAEFRTKIYDGTYKSVDSFALYHQFPADAQGGKKLWLLSVQRTGYAGTGIGFTLPNVTFDGDFLPNRVNGDPAGGIPWMWHRRVNEIGLETGGRQAIDYGQPHPCPTPTPTSGWDTNAWDCFPQLYDPPGAGLPAPIAFHRYLVEGLTLVDLVDASSPGQHSATESWTYDYQDTPAWHHNDSPFTPVGFRYWDQWRGHAKVRVVHGSGATTEQTRTDHRIFRGMHGDALAGGGTKSVTVTRFDGSTATDSEWLRGRTLDTRQINSAGIELSGASTNYYVNITPGTGSGASAARFVAPSSTTSRTRNDTSGTLTAVTTTTYDSYRRPSLVVEHGDPTTTNDDRCALTTWVTPNLSAYMVNFPAQIHTRNNTHCSSGSIARNTRYFYDQDTSTSPGFIGSDGNLTRTEVYDNTTWQPTHRDHDAYGRVITETDPNNHTTTTEYSPLDDALPSQITTTNHLGHTTTTMMSRGAAAPIKVIDPNENVTDLAYDSFGRLTKVWKATEGTSMAPGVPAGPASMQFAYVLHPNKLRYPFTHTQLLQSTGPTMYLNSVEVTDGHGRVRESQSPSPDPAKVIVTHTRYDTRGLPSRQSAPYAVTGSIPNPGDPLAGNNSAPNETVTFFQEQERPARAETWLAGVKVTGWDTGYSYPGYTTIATPPVGGGTKTTLDAHGRTASVSEEETGGIWRTATYRYNPAGDLTSIIDPAGNAISYTYDQAGRRRTMNDPDAGTWTYGYDAAGNQTTVTDATPAILHTDYDALNRPTARRQGPSGSTLAEWRYDATDELGLLDKTIRHQIPGTTTQDYITDITGYDPRNRPTGRNVSIPAVQGALSGSYSFGYDYDNADHQTEVDYPAISGGSVLPAETVTTGYSTTTGAPRTLGQASAPQYVSDTAWLPDGRIDTRTLGLPTDPNRVARTYGYDDHLRLDTWQATKPATSTTIQNDQITLDKIGNVTERVDALAAQRECFGYDPRNRLTSAYTTTNPACGTPTTTGPAPYDHTYTYAPDGRILSRLEKPNPTPVTYTYPTAPAGPPTTPVVGDWDGDGYDTPGLYVPSTGEVMVRNDNSDGPPDTTFTASYALAGDVPIVGDWDGDGDDTLGVYRPSTRLFYARNTLTTGTHDITTASAFGASGSKPIVGDWDGDGDDTIGVYDPATRQFHARNSFTGGAAQLTTTAYGGLGDTPLVGDWDGNGTTTIAVYQPAGHDFLARNTFSAGTPNLSASYGTTGDLPLAGNWDGDNDDTIGIYRPTDTYHHLRNAFTGGPADISTTFRPPGPIPQPHAVTDIGASNDCDANPANTPDYCYDPNGNMTGRPGTGGNQTLAWDTEHRLTSVTDPTGTTDFVYDPDGNRLIRRTPTNTTLYIEGHELTLTGTTLTTKRYYTLAGIGVAVRDSAGGQLTYLLGDQLGSTSVSVNASTGAVATQRYLPYGGIRLSSGTQATEKGWIGQTKDGSTGLQYLNARYYDPAIGRFAATDTLADLSVPGTLDTYGYAGGSPVTSKDPSGLLCEGDNPCGQNPGTGAPTCIGSCVGAGGPTPPAGSHPDHRPPGCQTAGCSDPVGPNGSVEGGINYFSGGPDVRYQQTVGSSQAAFCGWPSRWSMCNRIGFELRDESIALAAELAGQHGWSLGQRNAFRHAFWMASITLEYGGPTAREVGQRHETDTTRLTLVDEWDGAADLWNNAIGISVARTADTLSYISNAGSASVPSPKDMVITELTYQVSCECSGHLVFRNYNVGPGGLAPIRLDTEVPSG